LYDAGLKHLDDCPIEPKIPIYLLVGGCFGLLKLLSLLLNQVILRHAWRHTRVIPYVFRLLVNEFVITNGLWRNPY